MLYRMLLPALLLSGCATPVFEKYEAGKRRELLKAHVSLEPRYQISVVEKPSITGFRAQIHRQFVHVYEEMGIHDKLAVFSDGERKKVEGKLLATGGIKEEKVEAHQVPVLHRYLAHSEQCRERVETTHQLNLGESAQRLLCTQNVVFTAGPEVGSVEGVAPETDVEGGFASLSFSYDGKVVTLHSREVHQGQAEFRPGDAFDEVAADDGVTEIRAKLVYMGSSSTVTIPMEEIRQEIAYRQRNEKETEWKNSAGYALQQACQAVSTSVETYRKVSSAIRRAGVDATRASNEAGEAAAIHYNQVMHWSQIYRDRGGQDIKPEDCSK